MTFGYYDEGGGGRIKREFFDMKKEKKLNFLNNHE